jgi:hypothetical protein
VGKFRQQALKLLLRLGILQAPDLDLETIASRLAGQPQLIKVRKYALLGVFFGHSAQERHVFVLKNINVYHLLWPRQQVTINQNLF